MSKRSYRRLAVVAGAALAVGSMAPAMAIHIDGLDAKAVGTADVSVDTIDVSDVMGTMESADLSLPTNLVFGTIGNVKTTLGYHAPILVGDVLEVLEDVKCPVGVALDLDVAAKVLASAGLNVGNGNIGVGAGALGVVAGGLDAIEDLQECIGAIKADVFETVGDTKAAVHTVAGLATTTAFGAVGTASSVPGAVLGVATPLLLGDLLSVEASGAALVSIF